MKTRFKGTRWGSDTRIFYRRHDTRREQRGEETLAACILGGVDGVELRDVRDEADGREHPVERVITGRARHEVGGGGREAELVE